MASNSSVLGVSRAHVSYGVTPLLADREGPHSHILHWGWDNSCSYTMSQVWESAER